VEDDQEGDESSYSVTLSSPRMRIALSDSEKPETLTDNLGIQFQPVTDPSVPTVIELVDVLLKSNFMTPAKEPKLTNSEEVRKVISDLNFSKVMGPSDIPN
jgi:hypothetical protein